MGKFLFSMIGTKTRALKRPAVFMLSIAVVMSAICGLRGPQSVRAQAAAKAQQGTGQAAAGKQDEQQTDAGETSPERKQEILDHLNAVLRFYHDAEAPIQKVGEPSDLLYRDQSVTLATEIAAFAFQSAKAETTLRHAAESPDAAAPQSQAQRMQALRQTAEQRITELKAQDAALDKQIEGAKPRDVVTLEEQRQRVQGELELQTAMADSLSKIAGTSGAAGEGGFAAEIDQMERSAPGVATGKATAVAPTLENLSSAGSEGVTTQAKILFELLGTRQDIDNLIKEADDLHAKAATLRTPLTAMLRTTIAQGETMSQQAAADGVANGAANGAAAGTAVGVAAPSASRVPALSAAAEIAATRKDFDSLTRSFKNLSGAVVPISQEIVGLEQARASLAAWRAAVNLEYVAILRSLLARVAAIAIALAIIFILGDVWRRLTTRYVHDVRRRRQLLIVRRLLVGFLSGVVMIFGLVTQFSSLATFAGFITAGIAVGLQTILLSVAAYFFIIGRYGVKVGDRITISGVTGDVIEVGLVRFYIQEMAVGGTDFYPTGRVAVFSNAVLFQAGTPLYKQMPGTDYAWHELTVKLSPDVDYRPAVQEILKSAGTVYDGYKGQIERQHQSLEAWTDAAIDAPGLVSNLQLVDGGLQLWIRFPVMIRQAAAIDGKMTESLLGLIAGNPTVKSAVTGAPIIKTTVKG